MMKFLMIREEIKKFIGRYQVVVQAAAKFIFTFVVLTILNVYMGYNTYLMNPVMVLILALVAAVTPLWVITVEACMFILGHFFQVSLELTIFGVILLTIMTLMYFSFHIGNSWVMIVAMTLGLLNIGGAVIGFSAVLSLGITNLVPVCFGFVLSALILFVGKSYASIFGGSNALDSFDQITSCMDVIINNSTLQVLIIGVILALFIIFFMRKISFLHAWYVSVVLGSIVFVVILLIGNLFLDAEFNLVTMIGSVVAGDIIGSVVHMLDLILDYTRVEYSSFEDDEYYYYVKAVPKIYVSVANKEVKTINYNSTEKSTVDQSTKYVVADKYQQKNDAGKEKTNTARIIRELEDK
ncbi:MAG: hypothetical protein ACI4C1_00140 [Lachnospiraceae bacterium]